MKIRYGNSVLIKYSGNKKVILLNPYNKCWIRMDEALYESKMVDPDDFMAYLDEKYKLFEDSDEQGSRVESIYYSVTGKCNMKCKFCALNCGPNVSTENDMTIDSIMEMVKQIKELPVRKVVITGGEPLVRNDILEILKCFAEYIGNDKITLQTNGLLLSHKFIVDVCPYINYLEVSIENFFSNRELLKKMEKIFHTCLKYRVALSFSFVVDKESLQYFGEALNFSEKFNAHFQYRIVSNIGRATENDLSLSDKEIVDLYIKLLDYIIAEPEKGLNYMESLLGNLYPQRSCGAYGKVLAIHPDGEVFMCANLVNEQYSIGNIKKNGVNTVLENLSKKLQDKEIKKVFLVDNAIECRRCKYIYFCNGKCAAETVERFGSEDFCYLKKKMLEFKLFYIDKKKSKLENIYYMREYFSNIREELESDKRRED